MNPPQKERIDYLWDYFEEYAGDNGISLEYEDDWGPPWELWKAAIDASREP